MAPGGVGQGPAVGALVGVLAGAFVGVLVGEAFVGQELEVGRIGAGIVVAVVGTEDSSKNNQKYTIFSKEIV